MMTGGKGNKDKDGQVLPASGNSTASDQPVPEKSDVPIGMPNINKVVQKELERLTKEVINDIKTIMLADVDYASIDYIPEDEIDIPRNTDYIRNQFNAIYQRLANNLESGNNQSTRFDYPKYLSMFNVRYNSTNGKPEITLVLDFDGAGADDLRIRRVAIDRSGK